MRVFWQVLKTNLKTMVQYRGSFMISLAIDPIVLFINIKLFAAIFAYNQTNTILGYSLSQMIWYFGVTTFVWYFTWNFTDRRIAEIILLGDMVIDLLRPVSISASRHSSCTATSPSRASSSS